MTRGKKGSILDAGTRLSVSSWQFLKPLMRSLHRMTCAVIDPSLDIGT